MGVTEDRRHIYFAADPTSGGDNRPRRNRNDSSGSSDGGGWEIIPHDGVEDAQATAPPPPPAPRRARPPPSPKPRKVPRCGHELKLKKGRRSRHRYNNERTLFNEGFGPEASDLPTEDYLDGADIMRESRSHFATLLKEGNSRLLEAFLEQEDDEIVRMTTEKKEMPFFAEDPEDAYLSISISARTALKKHFPMGMLNGLEVEIRDFFVEHPDEEFVAAELSSYERLLAHAACMYHQLNSGGFDDDGKRKLKVNNPRGRDFKPAGPSLSKYLGMRSSRKEE